MTSDDKGKNPQNRTRSHSATTGAKTAKSARPRARTAKKNVTIDLEAKDVTPKAKTAPKKATASAAKSR